MGIYKNAYHLSLAENMDILLKVGKFILFFLLAPIYVPAYLLMNFTFKWWSSLLNK